MRGWEREELKAQDRGAAKLRAGAMTERPTLPRVLDERQARLHKAAQLSCFHTNVHPRRVLKSMRGGERKQPCGKLKASTRLPAVLGDADRGTHSHSQLPSPNCLPSYLVGARLPMRQHSFTTYVPALLFAVYAAVSTSKVKKGVENRHPEKDAARLGRSESFGAAFCTVPRYAHGPLIRSHEPQKETLGPTLEAPHRGVPVIGVRVEY